MVKLYHCTGDAVAAAIIADGFRDGTGSYLTSHQFTGVWFADRPLDVNDFGAMRSPGEQIVLEITAPDNGLEDWELVEEGKLYREWVIPAATANEWPRRLLSEDEWDKLGTELMLARMTPEDRARYPWLTGREPEETT